MIIYIQRWVDLFCCWVICRTSSDSWPFWSSTCTNALWATIRSSTRALCRVV